MFMENVQAPRSRVADCALSALQNIGVATLGLQPQRHPAGWVRGVPALLVYSWPGTGAGPPGAMGHRGPMRGGRLHAGTGRGGERGFSALGLAMPPGVTCRGANRPFGAFPLTVTGRPLTSAAVLLSNMNPRFPSCLCRSVLTFTALLLAGCASATVDVQPVSAGTSPLRVVYIQRNAQADEVAPDLASAIEDGFQRHHIGTKVITGEPPRADDYLLTYSAAGGWDLKPYLKTAEVRLKRGFNQVGLARYQTPGGFDPDKFASTRAKVDPLLEQLLASFH